MTGRGDYVVMMVCLGNICRSPMAASVVRHDVAAAGLADRVTVLSSGTGGWHVGEQADSRARATLAAHGYDTAHEARQFNSAQAGGLDLILAMDASNLQSLRALLGDDPRVRMFRSFDPALSTLPVGDPRLDVPDPYYGGPSGFTQVLAMVERASAGLVTHLRATLATDGG